MLRAVLAILALTSCAHRPCNALCQSDTSRVHVHLAAPLSALDGAYVSFCADASCTSGTIHLTNTGAYACEDCATTISVVAADDAYGLDISTDVADRYTIRVRDAAGATLIDTQRTASFDDSVCCPSLTLDVYP